jgi:hypothetical protein
MVTDDNKKCQKNADFFYCDFCDFICCKKSNYTSHLLTPKHQKHENGNKNGNNYGNKVSLKNAEKCRILTSSYMCNCGKEYKHLSGLSRHKKICSNQTNYNDSHVLTNFVLEVVKQNKELTLQNQELTNKILESLNDVMKNGIQNTNSYNTNINSNNKSFNLQFFLNETCKDAMNMMDFVESIQLQLSDLERIGEVGYVNGISNIIVQHLKELDITKRPVHCTDKKREIMYIKDNNKWEKEEDEKKNIRKFIKKVANKNIRLLQKFKEAHPDCIHSDSRYSDQYNKIIVESMGGSGDNDVEKEDKIIKNITKHVLIDKEQFLLPSLEQHKS